MSGRSHAAPRELDDTHLPTPWGSHQLRTGDKRTLPGQLSIVHDFDSGLKRCHQAKSDFIEVVCYSDPELTEALNLADGLARSSAPDRQLPGGRWLDGAGAGGQDPGAAELNVAPSAPEEIPPVPQRGVRDSSLALRAASVQTLAAGAHPALPPRRRDSRRDREGPPTPPTSSPWR